MVPHRLALVAVDSRRRTSLLAEVEALLVTYQQIALDEAIR